jgi:hypothetical protein
MQLLERSPEQVACHMLQQGIVRAGEAGACHLILNLAHIVVSDVEAAARS